MSESAFFENVVASEKFRRDCLRREYNSRVDREEVFPDREDMIDRLIDKYTCDLMDADDEAIKEAYKDEIGL